MPVIYAETIMLIKYVLTVVNSDAPDLLTDTHKPEDKISFVSLHLKFFKEIDTHGIIFLYIIP